MKVRKDPWPQYVCVLGHLSHVWLFVALLTLAHQASLLMGFSRQEHWSGCHALLQQIFPTQGSNLTLLCILHCRKILHHGPPEKSHWAWTVFKSVEANSTKLQGLGMIFGSCSSLWACWSAPLLSFPFCGRWSMFEDEHFHQPVSC